MSEDVGVIYTYIDRTTRRKIERVDDDIDTDTVHDTHIYIFHEADTYQLMWSDHDDNIDTENENWYWYQYSGML